LGVETVIRLEGEYAKGVVFGDGVEEEARAFGLFGGKEGAINELEFKFPDGSIHKPESKEILSDLPEGTVLRQIAGGGGGYGVPHLRAAEQVAKEVRNGILSVRKAFEDYKVVINPETLEIDLTETNLLRGTRSG